MSTTPIDTWAVDLADVTLIYPGVGTEGIMVVATVVLWGHPSSPYEGFAPITPWGQFAGAIIMFWVLGFFPAWVLAKILASLDLLRIPREIELLGLDFASDRDREAARHDVIAAKRAMV